MREEVETDTVYALRGIQEQLKRIADQMEDDHKERAIERDAVTCALMKYTHMARRV